MTEAERIARAAQARSAMEIIGPILDEMQASYTARIVETANTELLFWKRTGKLTTLSNGLRIVEQIRSGISVLISDGDMAMNDRLRAEKIKQMSSPQRRLLQMGSGN